MVVGRTGSERADEVRGGGEGKGKKGVAKSVWQSSRILLVDGEPSGSSRGDLFLSICRYKMEEARTTNKAKWKFFARILRNVKKFEGLVGACLLSVRQTRERIDARPSRCACGAQPWPKEPLQAVIVAFSSSRTQETSSWENGTELFFDCVLKRVEGSEDTAKEWKPWKKHPKSRNEKMANKVKPMKGGGGTTSELDT